MLIRMNTECCLYCRNHDTEIYAFGQRFGEEFDEALLKRAFIQRFVTIFPFL